MDGPSHYREAEKLLASADIAIGQFEEHGWDAKRQIADTLTAEAQVRATLALAAAVMPELSELLDESDRMAILAGDLAEVVTDERPCNDMARDLLARGWRRP